MPSGANTEPLGFRKRVDIPIAESETAATFDMSSNNGVFLPAVDNSLASNDNSAPPDPPEKETPRRERHHKRSRSKERNHRSSGAGREDRDRRRRSRSRDEDRDRDRGRDRHRDRDSYRDKDRDRDRRRSRSRDRERRHRRYSGDRNNDGSTLKDEAPLFGPVLPPTPNAINVGYTGGTPFANDYGIPTTPGTPNSEGSEKGGKRKRKSRWSKETEKAFVPGMPTMIPTNLTDDQRRAYLLQLQIEDITRKLRTGDFGIPPNPENRSPSPEPVYDTHGKRLNTREVRTRQNLETSRHCMIQEMMKLNPHYKPPPDYKAPQSKLNAKVWIPQDENPEINFVGLLIGPRGNTLKELEKLTGSRIIIRGKGSVKEGKIAKRDGPLPGEDEPLHAYITATDPAAIDRAVNKINELITQALEIPDQENALRKDQLRQLALLNGTLRGDELALTNRCSNCGATTHKSWECPDRPNVTANVYCSACGSAGHLTKDCKNPRPGGVGGGGGMGSALDDEYSALMAELGQGDGDRIVSKQPIVRINLTKPRPPPLVGSGSTPIPPPWMGPPPPPMPPPWGWGPPMPHGMPMPPMPPMPPGMNMNPMMAPPPPPPPIDHNKNASHEDGDGMIPPPPPDYCPPPMMMGWPPMMSPMFQNPIPPPPPAPPSNLVGGDGDDYYAGLFGAAPPPPPPPPPNS